MVCATFYRVHSSFFFICFQASSLLLLFLLFLVHRIAKNQSNTFSSIFSLVLHELFFISHHSHKENHITTTFSDLLCEVFLNNPCEDFFYYKELLKIRIFHFSIRLKEEKEGRTKKIISISKITFKCFFMLNFRSHIFLCDRQNVKIRSL